MKINVHYKKIKEKQLLDIKNLRINFAHKAVHQSLFETLQKHSVNCEKIESVTGRNQLFTSVPIKVALHEFYILVAALSSFISNPI